MCIRDRGRYEARIAYNRQRTEDYKNGSYTMGGGLPQEAPEEAPQYVKDYVAYYKTAVSYTHLSCNPETLARDLRYLVKKGYEAVRAVPYDMFAWTEHVEVVIMMRNCGFKKK